MRLSIIPQKDNIEFSLKLASQFDLGFEYNDFMMPEILDDEQKTLELIDFYNKAYERSGRDRKRDTLHGAFFDIVIHSSDSLIKAVSSKRVHQCMDVAKALGVKGVVFHTNIIPNFTSEYFIKGFVDKSIAYWTELCAEYSDIDVYLENMFDMSYEPIKALAEGMSGVKNFGLCLDYAHAAVFGEAPAGWLKELAAHIKHMHINDNDLKTDSHLALGQGKIDYREFLEVFNNLGIDASVLIEVSGQEKIEQSLTYLKDAGVIC